MIALLFANSPSLFYRQDLPLTWCARDAFYRASAIGLAPHNLGPYDQHFSTCDDLIARFAQCAIWYIQDAQGRYIFFPPLELATFLERDKVCGYLEQPAQRWSPFTFKPEASHLRFFKGFKDITFTRHNTIEFRGCCQQPLSGAFEPAAFIAGCAANPEAALAALAPLNNLPPNSQMRRFAVTPSIFEYLPRARLRPVISTLVDAAAQGLIQRGYGEESLLDGVRDRVDRLICPASIDVERWQQGMPLEEIIHLNASVTTPATVMDNGN